MPGIESVRKYTKDAEKDHANDERDHQAEHQYVHLILPSRASCVEGRAVTSAAPPIPIQ